jgi:DNA-binding MarR family transcriptional regulator
MTTTRWLTEREERAWRGYRRMRALLDLQVNRDLANDAGLSEPDYDVLSNVSESPGRSMRMNELAARMLWTRTRVSHQVRRMEQRGLVARTACEGDARGAVVVLTESGWQAIRAAAPDHVRSVRENLVDLLTPEQLETLGDVAETVIEHLSGIGPTAPAQTTTDSPGVSRR